MVQGDHGLDVGCQQGVNQLVVVVNTCLVDLLYRAFGQEPRPGDGEAVVINLEVTLEFHF